MLDLLKPPFLSFQDFFILTARAIRSIVRRPHYGDDVAIQMDIIGVGSLPIVVLTGLFSGFVMALQMARALTQYGASGEIGQITAIAIVRELGPTLTALMVAGRNASGMASELGSMKVTEQIDAMRALGTDPVAKLVKPRLLATSVVLPLLTVISDFFGLLGGYLVGCYVFNLTTPAHYWNSAWRALEYDDLAQGLLKPLSFAVILSLVGCFYGMRTSGGTQGVGLATTKAMVVASVWIFVVNSVITRLFV